jgi:adenylosuccinate synthase
LLEEMDSLAAGGSTSTAARRFARAHLISVPPGDRQENELKGVRKIGTTGRGIGPAYVDKMARVGLRSRDS